MRILVRVSCTNSFCDVQNQSYFSFVPLFSAIFSNRKLQLVGKYIHKMVIEFVFCVVSLLWTSSYVLIYYTRLTHFLCCNLFVMMCWTISAISVNVLEICSPITSVLSTLIVRSTSSQMPLRLSPFVIFENVLKTRMSHPAVLIFMRFASHFIRLYEIPHESRWLFSKFCKPSQNLHCPPTHMPIFP